jgi:hypothetical protein
MYDIFELVFWLLVLSIIYSFYIYKKKEHFLNNIDIINYIKTHFDDNIQPSYNTYSNINVPYKYGNKRFLETTNTISNWWPWFTGYGDNLNVFNSNDYDYNTNTNTNNIINTNDNRSWPWYVGLSNDNIRFDSGGHQYDTDNKQYYNY